MGIMKAFILESRNAAYEAHFRFRKLHKYPADACDPAQLAELMRYARESMAEMGWGPPEKQSERLVKNLETEVVDWTDPEDGSYPD
jgi:hypothetical protein